jgi:hypothetical protein
MSSESPPLSGDKPLHLRSNCSCAQHGNEEMLRFLMGGFIPPSEHRENNPDLQSEYEWNKLETSQRGNAKHKEFIDNELFR